MTKNPLINAILASAYIALVSVFINTAGKINPHPNQFFGPIAFLSIFCLSAAVMGSIFLLQPIQMFLENKKKEAVNLLLKTIAVFAVFTVIFISLVFSGILGR